jgi:hypothetical protein
VTSFGKPVIQIETRASVDFAWRKSIGIMQKTLDENLPLGMKKMAGAIEGRLGQKSQAAKMNHSE